MNVTTQDLMSQIGEQAVEIRLLRLKLADALTELQQARNRAANAEALVEQFKGEPKPGTGE